MAVRVSAFKTITCNNEKCGKTVTYEFDDRRPELEKSVFDNPENVWLKALRQITSLDNRMFSYCSDLCEIAGIETGQHNLPEQKKIIDASGASTAAVQAAAQAAAHAEEATKALKSGQGIVRG